ncbi:E3 ubiquitin-protein ligase RLIM-like, partial [Suricata suricatta]|uniref:E3 ubiquitin-protein ligase RLIM-like n=1 Tax=Suricata suricatta TaxID=37032 RepID=UPI001155A5AB
PGARAYNSENSQSPAENIESESTFIGSPGSEQSPAWNAGIPSLHILWSTGFDDIPSPPIQSPLRHTVTGSSDLSDSDLSDSDTDLVHSVSSLSSDMESEGSISETDASDATTPSVLNSYPSCDSSSTSTSISSSGSNYIIISSSSPIPSSSSSAEDSEGNSVIFVGSSNTRSSPGSLSETRHENRSLSPITFDYGDSWDQFYPVIYDSDDQWAGLPTVQIDNLPIRSYAEGDALQSCAICITEYTEGNRVRILPCTHQFHVDCVDRWLSENSTCPICRTEVAYSAQRQNSD